MKKGLFVVAVFLASIGFYVLSNFLPIHAGDDLYAQGRYEAAFAQYQKAENDFFFMEKAQEGMQKSRYGMAEAAEASGDYEAAIEIASTSRGSGTRWRTPTTRRPGPSWTKPTPC